MVEQLVSLGATHEKRNFNCVIVLERFLFSLLSIVKKVIRMRFWGRYFILQVELVSFRLPHKWILSFSDPLASTACLFQIPLQAECVSFQTPSQAEGLELGALPQDALIGGSRTHWALHFDKCFTINVFYWFYLREAFDILYFHAEAHFALFTCIYSDSLCRHILHCILVYIQMYYEDAFCIVLA